MTTSKKKSTVGLVKGIISPNIEGYIDIMDLQVNLDNHQTTLGQVFKEMFMLKIAMKEVYEKIELYRTSLKQFLQEHGYEFENDNLQTLLDKVQSIEVLNPTDQHYVALLKDGYVEHIIEIGLHQIVRNPKIPIDVLDGYYKVENGKIVLDEIRKEELEGLE